MQDQTENVPADERRSGDRRKKQVENLGFPDRRKADRRKGGDRRKDVRS